MDDLQHPSGQLERPMKAKRTYGRIRNDTSTVAHASSSSVEAHSRSRGDSVIRKEMLATMENGPLNLKAELKAMDDEYNRREDLELAAASQMVSGGYGDEKDGETETTSPMDQRPDDSFVTNESSIFENNSLLDSSQTSASSPASNVLRPTQRRKAVVHSEDSEEDDEAGNISTKRSNLFKPPVHRSPMLHSSDSDGNVPKVKVTRPSVSPTVEKPNELSSESPPKKKVSKAKGKTKEGKTDKVKKLSKREERESAKAHARLMAEQSVSLHKDTQSDEPKMRMTDFLVKIKTKGFKEPSLTAPLQVLQRQPSSDHDPIDQFHSPLRTTPNDTQPKTRQTLQPVPLLSISNDTQDLDSDSELEEPANLVQKIMDSKKKMAKTTGDLKAFKMQLVAGVSGAAASNGSDDDDLEISASPPHGHSQKRPRVDEPETDLSQSRKVLQRAAQPVFDSQSKRRAGLNDMSTDDLKRMVYMKSKKQREKLVKEKEGSWVQHGGSLNARSKVPAKDALTSVWQTLENSTEKNAEQNACADSEGESDDEDFEPQYSGESSASGEDEGDDETDAKSSTVATILLENARETSVVDHDDENEMVQPVPRKSDNRHRGARAVVDSDEDEDSNNIKNLHSYRATGKVLVPETSMIVDSPRVYRTAAHTAASMPSLGNDEFDKENNTTLVLSDEGEDKENLVIPQQDGSHNRNMFALTEGVRRRLSMSMSPTYSGPSQHRQPLQQKCVDDLEEAFPSVAHFSTKQSDSPRSQWSNTPEPLQRNGFSQFFDDDDGGPVTDENMPPPKSNAFSFSTSFSQPLQPKAGGLFDRLKRPNDAKELSLTLDTSLQPALDVNTQIRRKADAIFEKDQVLLLEEAARKPRAEPQLYVTENGMLTQTRPESSTPVLYRAMSLTQVPPGSVETRTLTQTQGKRSPLRTLSFSLSPTQVEPLQRLRKGRRSSDESESADQVLDGKNEEPKPRSALDALMQNRNRASKERAPKEKLGKFAFVEGEAVESDEDEERGFGRMPAMGEDEENSDNEDPDAVVEDLLDDQKMDADTENADLVVEKHQEHQEQDDQRIQKYHEMAIKGAFRNRKKRGGRVGLSDEESEDEDDDDARRVRGRYHKKRKVDADTLDELDPEGPFVKGYNDDLVDDSVNDFAYMAQDDMDIADGDEDDEPQETVTRSEIEAQLRQTARNNKGKEKVSQPFDPNNIEWADKGIDVEEEDYAVKEVDLKTKHITRSRRTFGQEITDEFTDRLPKTSSWDEEHLQNWRRGESNRRLMSGGGGAVTGHAKKTTITTTALQSRTAVTSESVHLTDTRQLQKNASVLARMDNKQSRFGS